MSTFSGDCGREEEDGAGWGGLVASKAEQRAETWQTALEKDAARFRWLQEHTVTTGLSCWMGSTQTLDVAVDAAMRASDQLAGCLRRTRSKR